MKPRTIILSDKSQTIDEDIESYCSNPRLQDIRKSVNEQNYNVNETDITYRMIGHWDTNKLLPESLRKNSGWRKFSFVEMVWLRIIKHLREFGLSLDKIRRVKECVMHWNEETNTYDEFEYYIFESWKSTSDPCLMVAYNGDAEIATLQDMNSAANMIGQHDMLVISLATVIGEVGFKVAEKQGLFNLTDEHIALLAEMNSRTNQEVKVKMDSGKMIEIESTYNVTTLLASEVTKQMRDKKFYGKVSIQSEKGVPQSIQVKKRKRF